MPGETVQVSPNGDTHFKTQRASLCQIPG